MEEYFFVCPYCGEQISMVLDLSQQYQEYIEDCEVCCNPISISFMVNERHIEEFQANPIEQKV